MVKTFRSAAMFRLSGVSALLLTFLLAACAPEGASLTGWGNENTYGTRDGAVFSSDNATEQVEIEIEEEFVFEEDDSSLGSYADFSTQIGDRIFFTVDRSDLSAEAKAVLDGQMGWLQGNPAIYMIVEGHADERGTREYNLALGARRAKSVRDYMVAGGVDPERINTISYGKERPVETCHDDSCWSVNRRAVTILQ